MRETEDILRLPSREVGYQPEPDTVAGFIASMHSKVDDLLSAAEFVPGVGPGVGKR